MAILPTGIKHTVSGFLSWWLSELEALWRPLSALGQRKPPALTITASDQKWIVSLHKGGRVKELGHVAVGSHPDVAKKALETIVRSVKLRHAELKILIPQHRALRKVLEMPSVTEPELRQALSFEIDRQTPFQSDDIYFDYRILARHPEVKRLVVELTTVPRATVEEVLKEVHGWGFQPSAVDVSSNDGGNGLGINLLRASDEDPRQGWSTLATAFALIFVLLLATVFYIPVRQLAALDESLAAQVATEKETGKQTIAVRDELDQTIKAARFLDERKNAVPSALLVLNELTKVLPDNTWLLTFIQNNKEVKISGYSAAAAELIPAIDAVSIFTKPAFTSPIVPDPQQKLERFEIMFNIDLGVAKK